ncbi:MAG: hypothetical protein QM789_20785 [Paenirhodobacter sp.]
MQIDDFQVVFLMPTEQGSAVPGAGADRREIPDLAADAAASGMAARAVLKQAARAERNHAGKTEWGGERFSPIPAHSRAIGKNGGFVQHAAFGSGKVCDPVESRIIGHKDGGQAQAEEGQKRGQGPARPTPDQAGHIGNQAFP